MDTHLLAYFYFEKTNERLMREHTAVSPSKFCYEAYEITLVVLSLL
jgi:hypothetical protein